MKTQRKPLNNAVLTALVVLGSPVALAGVSACAGPCRPAAASSTMSGNQPIQLAAATTSSQQPMRMAAANPCAAKNPCAAANPCAAKACNPCNPCAAANPCAAKACNPCNPCAAKNPCAAANPCAAKACNPCNPCAAKNPCAAANPCAVANPCAAANPCNPCNPCSPCGAASKYGPEDIQQPAGVALFAGSTEELEQRGEQLWSDASLSTNGLSCQTCHAGNAAFLPSFTEPYPHKVAMAEQVFGLDEINAAEMVQFCMVQPMAAEPLDWSSEELAALTAYTLVVQRQFQQSQ